jgi:ribosomal protein S27E
MKKGSKLKTDIYRKARGGHSRLLRLKCRKCKRLICIYQKDGPGPLRRMYIDRMNPKPKTKFLNCKCGAMIGTRYTYKKERRPAYKLYVDAVVKD